MIYLSGAVVPDMPAMLTPRMRQRPPEGLPWAADTGCYASPAEHDDDRYLRWLADLGPDRCLFATAPDRFGDAAATLELALPMLPRIAELGIRPALVAQLGLDELRDRIPWADMGALFVGGPDVWQGSEGLVELVAEARDRGLWVHMGRVNGLSRVRYAASLGCDSVDGTFLRYGRDANRPRLARWLDDLERAPLLWAP